MPGPVVKESQENLGFYTEPTTEHRGFRSRRCVRRGCSMVAIVNMPVDNGRMYMVLGQTWPSLLVTYTVQG